MSDQSRPKQGIYTKIWFIALCATGPIGETPYAFHGDGDSTVGKPRYEAGPETGKVWINADQYFENVPPAAWEHHIGGYQPAQKWLKGRKGRALSWDDIRHYQRIIKILSETARIMGEIEMPLD